MAKARTIRRRSNKSTEIDYEKRLTIPPEQAAVIAGYGRNQMYSATKSGFFPSIRNGRKILLLSKPFFAILRGERPPGKTAA